MLTGRQSFGGSDVSEALAAVIRADPDWNTLPTNLHPRLKEVLERCLEKDANRRFRDIGDVKLDVEKYRAASKLGISSMKWRKIAQIQISATCAAKTERTTSENSKVRQRTSRCCGIRRSTFNITSKLTP